MFFLYCAILIFVSIAMTLYHYKRQKVSTDRNTALYYMFVFIFAWIAFRVVYFADVWHNFNWNVLAWLSAVAIFFTFVCFIVAIDSM